MDHVRFSLRKEWYEVLKNMPKTIQAEVYHAVVTYAFTGTQEKVSQLALGLFTFIKSEIDREYLREEEILQKRKEGGMKGGAPRGNQNAKKTTKNNQNKQNNLKVELGKKTTQKSLRNPTENEGENNQNNQNNLKVNLPPKTSCKKEEIKTEKERTKEKEKNKEEKHTYTCAREREQGDSPLQERGAAATYPNPHTPLPPSPPSEMEVRYNKFMEWMRDNAPYIVKNFEHLVTYNEFVKLMDKYSPNDIAEAVSKVENRRDKRKIYVNLYRTLLNWLPKEQMQ